MQTNEPNFIPAAHYEPSSREWAFLRELANDAKRGLVDRNASAAKFGIGFEHAAWLARNFQSYWLAGY